ncbi:UNVERIFIED_CONTAM: hypothetical protein RMT77_017450 [Armadillidium vulgare]
MNSLLLILLYIYFAVVLIFLPSMCKSRVLSPLNTLSMKENVEIEEYKNQYRKQYAKEYIHNLNVSNKYFKYVNIYNKHMDHLFIIIPSHRLNSSSGKETLALTQLVTEIDKNIKEEKSMKADFFICDQSEKTDELKNLEKFFPSISESKIKKYNNIEDFYRSSFVNCVQIALEKLKAKPNYVTIIRESLLPYSNFLSKLHFLIERKIENSIFRGELQPTNNDWLFLHLHEPIPFRYYGLNWCSIREIFIILITGGAIFYLFGNALNINKYSKASTPIFCMFGSVLLITLAFGIGRPYIIEIRRSFNAMQTFYAQPSPVFVSAVTLPAAGASIMVEYLQRLTCSQYVPFSDVWDHSVSTLGKEGYIASPSLMRYIANV